MADTKAAPLPSITGNEGKPTEPDRGGMNKLERKLEGVAKPEKAEKAEKVEKPDTKPAAKKPAAKKPKKPKKPATKATTKKE